MSLKDKEPVVTNSGDANSRHSSSSEDELADYQGFDQNIADKVQDLARTLSKTSSLHLTRTESNISFTSFKSKDPYVPFVPQDLDPRLDPASDNFNSKLWVYNLQRLMHTDENYYKPVSLGVTFKNLRATGFSVDADYQSDFGNFIPKYAGKLLNDVILRKPKPEFDILKPMDGLLRPGEVCVVLGKPGAGCTTFLKTISSQTHGFHVAPESQISYDGFTPHEIYNHHRGDVIYCAETENHFPKLTVRDTLLFAAKLKVPSNRPTGVTRQMYAEHMTDVYLATYGLSHTKNTLVGNDFVRGVSGGERKRVSICEAALCGAKIQCWDNSTRGLDSATALEFIKALKTSAVISKTTPMIAIYQCSQNAYDLFDTVQLLYEGYQIYFGNAKAAKDYFLKMGFECPPRQTTADYLTSITSPSERIAKKGFENKVPKHPKEFYDYWMSSPEHAALVKEIDEYNGEVAHGAKERFEQAHIANQAKRQRPASPYTVNYWMQITELLHRNWLRIKIDPYVPVFEVVFKVIMALVVSSVFFNLQNNSGSFYSRTAGLFFATLVNAFGSLLEIIAVYEARSIVEKHRVYALYHPSADAFASIIADIPVKILNSLGYNLIFYFMANLKREPGSFFFYILINFITTFAMSHIFRTIGCCFNSLPESMTPSAIFILILMIFTGFVIPRPDLLGWIGWLIWLNPVAYSFEALMANEFHGRKFDCSTFIPSGPGYPKSGSSVICSTVSAKAGERFIYGDDYIDVSYAYKWDHAWRNFGIIIAFALVFLLTYVTLVEYSGFAAQNGEVLLFQKRHLRQLRKLQKKAVANGDIESGSSNEKVAIADESTEQAPEHGEKALESKHDKIFHWRDLVYQVKIKSEDRIILNGVSGFVKPGTVTALMGASGAGKTTLLNALSARLTSGVVTNGTRMVNGRPLDNSFSRSIGYVQQQDLHLQTSTVREALLFSAELRQPASVSKAEKAEYVEEVIDLLEMRPYASAVVGVPGEGLNVEQRKRLTIGVELAAKPDLLIFLDEPTSGLDSQTAWSICQLIKKLANHGHAILCTIHQPSAILMQEFDRLLFLKRGGQTVYFGELGKECTTMIQYFEKYGAPKCPPEANPAEWMLEVIGAAPGSKTDKDYYEVWKNSDEYASLNRELDEMETELAKLPVDDNPEKMKTFALPIYKQFYFVIARVFQQTWRTPSYVYSKLLLAVSTALFNGFVFFKARNSLMGLQSQMFSVFMFISVFNCLVQQYLPIFVFQRDLYEARERPSKTFSWVSFIAAQIVSEIPWQILAGTLSFFCWYYPVGFYNNAANAGLVTQRGALSWILIVLFYVYTASIAQLTISFNELEIIAANICSLLFMLCLTFCGVLATPKALPGFWIFMYRVSPFTYFVAGMLELGVSDGVVECSAKEYLVFDPPSGETCGSYMKEYISLTMGYLKPETVAATSNCSYCTMSSANQYLTAIDMSAKDIPRNIGVFACYIFINYIGVWFFYWLARVPKGSQKRVA